jgi:hypothetical protein
VEPERSAIAMRMRASSTTAPRLSASSGLMSSSTISGHVGHQARHLHQGGEDRVHVGLRVVAVALEQARDAGAR